MGGLGLAVHLRQISAEDLPILFEHQADRAASAMADFPSRDREAFDAHWAQVMQDPAVTIRVIEVDGEVAGAVQSWRYEEEQRAVGYWIGRSLWGRGIATAALAEFLHIDRSRPLHAHVATTNRGSQRVLEKCGFVQDGELEDGFAYVLR